MIKMKLKPRFFLLFFLLLPLRLPETLTSKAQSNRGGEALDEEVFIHVRFTTPSGQAVTDIRREEIRVLAEGKSQQVRRVMYPDEPFDIGLLMDVSPSKEEAVDSIRHDTARFVSFFPLQNPIMVLTFDSQVYVDCDWTTDRKKVDEALWEFGLHKPGGSTVLREAVVLAVEQKFLPRKPRTAMILFSDGVDTGSGQVSEKESLEVLKKSGVLTYCVQHFSFAFHRKVHYPTPRSPRDIQSIPGTTGTKVGPIFVGRGRTSERDWAEYKVKTIHENAVKYLRQLAQAGGGLYLQLATINELGKAYDKIAEELSQVYTISFIPSHKRGERFHSIRVMSTRDDVIARYRPAGYWAAR
ncbi:VWA domain-containing protein [Acidobacteria bacterium AH-259-A15]|nr:VWA domain-containing protein [Acidobacteria bacterium AH-259-A15]